MKSKLLAVAALAIAGSFTVDAQQVTISPIPQSVQWGGKAFDASAASYYVCGTVDDATDALLAAKFGTQEGGNMAITVGVKGQEAVASVADKIPAQAEGYYLSVKPDGIIVAGSDAAGAFYGVQTLLQVLSQPEVQQVTVTDYPMTAWRGVIEGFYGNPWSFNDRVSQFDFYGTNKMNIYVYGPKDDPYHHSQWYTPYPEAEAAKMAELVKHATDNKVKFVWAMHPSNSIQTDTDRQKALDKFEQMYGLGVRAFSIFFDDISAESVDYQVSYLNFLTDNFVNKKPDVEPLIVCPTQYNKSWSSGSYLSTMGSGLYPEIKIMWTGNSVVDMIQKADCDWFTGQTGRKPFIWLNYPVNDYGQHNLLMGPVEGNGADVFNYVEAFCSNPMQYAEASKVALYSLADYCWNPAKFDSQAAWTRSMSYLMPDHTQAFTDFCITNVDVAPSTHGLRLYGETPEFKAIQDKYPQLTAEAAEAYAAYFNRMKASAEELLALKGESAMVDEILEFIQYFDYQSLRGAKAMEMAKALDSNATDDFIAAYVAYKEATDAAGKLVSRGFSGSIQSVAPHAGTLYVEPFIKSTVSQLVNAFKNSGAEYPKDIFPAQLLENGLYHIKVDGKLLTNVSSSSNPTLQAAADEVNPGRQLWIITLEPATNRYSIKNEWDKRYVNELGNFGTNPYDDNWNTYVITRFEGKYAIQNAGSSGNAYWDVTGTNRLGKGSKNAYHSDNFIFEIVPADGDSEVDHPTIIGKQVYLLNSAGKAFTSKGKGNVGAFDDVKTPANGLQLFTATIESETGCVKFTNAAGGQHLDEIGRVGSNSGYGATWNTYAVCEMGGLYSIQYVLESKNYYGARYWIPGDSQIEYSTDLDHYDSYLFRIVDRDTMTGIADVEAEAPAANTIYDLTGRKVANPGAGLYIVNGQKQLLLNH